MTKHGWLKKAAILTVSASVFPGTVFAETTVSDKFTGRNLYESGLGQSIVEDYRDSYETTVTDRLYLGSNGYNMGLSISKDFDIVSTGTVTLETTVAQLYKVQNEGSGWGDGPISFKLSDVSDSGEETTTCKIALNVYKSGFYFNDQKVAYTGDDTDIFKPDKDIRFKFQIDMDNGTADIFYEWDGEFTKLNANPLEFDGLYMNKLTVNVMNSAGAYHAISNIKLTNDDTEIINDVFSDSGKTVTEYGYSVKTSQGTKQFIRYMKGGAAYFEQIAYDSADKYWENYNEIKRELTEPVSGGVVVADVGVEFINAAGERTDCGNTPITIIGTQGEILTMQTHENTDAETKIKINGQTLNCASPLNSNWYHGTFTIDDAELMFRFVIDYDNNTIEVFRKRIKDGVWVQYGSTYDAAAVLNVGGEVNEIKQIKVSAFTDATKLRAIKLTDLRVYKVDKKVSADSYLNAPDCVTQNGYDISGINAGDKITVAVPLVAAAGDFEKNAVIIAAFYDNNDNFISFASKDIKIPGAEAQSADTYALEEMEITVPEGAECIKAFCWDSLKTVTPLTDVTFVK